MKTLSALLFALLLIASSAARAQNPSCAEWDAAFASDTAQKEGMIPVPQPTLTVKYGGQPLQDFDVFLPPKGAFASKSPIILFVHGGGWCVGNKAMATNIKNKVERWVPKGFIFVSMNYRKLPQGAAVSTQLEDVAAAVAKIQEQAKGWGGDGEKLILMGHSSGGHLITLLSADAAYAARKGLKPWLAAIAVDGAALDMPHRMRGTQQQLFIDAMGSDEKYWLSLSPLHAISAASLPFFGICSPQTYDACNDALAYATQSQAFGVPAQVISEDLEHYAVNTQLGLPGAYTDSVEKFMGSLDPSLAERLK